MSEVKHTRGPWSRDKYGHIVDADGLDVRFRSLTILSSGSEGRMAEAEANTTLAAAAPELLAELERAALLLMACTFVITHDESRAHAFKTANTARALIAKALGEHS